MNSFNIFNPKPTEKISNQINPGVKYFFGNSQYFEKCGEYIKTDKISGISLQGNTL